MKVVMINSTIKYGKYIGKGLTALIKHLIKSFKLISYV